MTERAKILHLRTASSHGGGPDKTLLNTGRLIDPERFDYRVVYLRKRTGSIDSILRQAGEAGLDYREFPGSAFLDPAQFARLACHVRRERPAILHCHDPKSDVYGILLRRWVGRPKLVSTMHGWLPGGRRRFTNRVDLWALRRFDRVFAVSRHTERIAARRGITRVSVIYNAIDTEEWRPRAPEDADRGKTVVGFVGRLSPEKGPMEFLAAAKRLARDHPKIEFLVAGDGPLANAMKEEARRANLTHRCRFLGHVEGREVADIYRRMDILLSPSWTEGLPNTVLEACATGVPVVATRVGGVEEIIEHGRNGLLSEAGDIEGLAMHVLAVAQDSDLRRRLTQRARQVVEERFSMRARTERLQALYADVLEQRTPAS